MRSARVSMWPISTMAVFLEELGQRAEALIVEVKVEVHVLMNGLEFVGNRFIE
ncbi:MAG: hypothetical protein QM757_39880 [Paludibaculum sp.]